MGASAPPESCSFSLSLSFSVFGRCWFKASDRRRRVNEGSLASGFCPIPQRKSRTRTTTRTRTIEERWREKSPAFPLMVTAAPLPIVLVLVIGLLIVAGLKRVAEGRRRVNEGTNRVRQLTCKGIEHEHENETMH